MLVLTRRLNETIKIGDDVEITVVDVKGDKVKLGIVAPVTVPVHRKEIWLEIQKENADARAESKRLSRAASPTLSRHPAD